MTRIIFLNKQHTKWIETTDGFKPRVTLTNGAETLVRTILYYKWIGEHVFFAISYKGSIIDIRTGTTDITGLLE